MFTISVRFCSCYDYPRSARLCLNSCTIYIADATRLNNAAKVPNNMVFTDYVKQRILFYHQQGRKSRKIRNLLLGEGIQCSHIGIYLFLKRFERYGTIARHPGSGRPSKITTEVKRIVVDQMQLDDETTATQLHSLLAQKGVYYWIFCSMEVQLHFCKGHKLSLRTILLARKGLGWVFGGSAYCQMIRYCRVIANTGACLRSVNIGRAIR